MKVTISQKLIKAVGFNPTKKSHQMSIQDMCNKIKTNKITLPLYQRDLSWNLRKAVALLNYQLFGKAPVAPISINQLSLNTNTVPQVSFLNREVIDSKLIEADNLSVVDGQQRLTTNFKAFIDHEDFRNIVLDVSSAKFKIVEGAIRKNQIPVGKLLNENLDVLKNYLDEQGTIMELYTHLVDVRSKIRSYNYTLNVAENLTEDEQIEWFEVLNNAGSRVTTLQMSFSKLKVHNFDIYTDYVQPFKSKAMDYGFEELFTPFTTNVSYPVAALNPAYEMLYANKIHKMNYAPIPSDTKETKITNLEKRQLEELVRYTLDSLEAALKFISENELDSKIQKIDYILYLLGYFSFNGDVMDENRIKDLVSWVENVNFVNKTNPQRRLIYKELLEL